MTKLIDLMPDAKDVYVGKGITVYDVKQRLRKLEAVREAAAKLYIHYGSDCDPDHIYQAVRSLGEALAACGDE